MKLVGVSKSHQGAVWEVTIPALFSVEKLGRSRSDFDGLYRASNNYIREKPNRNLQAFYPAWALFRYLGTIGILFGRNKFNIGSIWALLLVLGFYLVSVFCNCAFWRYYLASICALLSLFEHCLGATFTTWALYGAYVGFIFTIWGRFGLCLFSLFEHYLGHRSIWALRSVSGIYVALFWV